MDRSTHASRLRRLLGFLKHDPENLRLIGDAAGAALDEDDAPAALGLLDRYAALAPLPAALLNLKGIAALHGGQYETAVAALSSLRDQGEESPAVR